MHYAVSDIHGCYDKYLALLERISFSAEDTLFFLGDAADRGPDGIAVIRDLMHRPNVISLLGNHEDMFRKTARCLGKELSGEERSAYARTFRNWTVRNGGDATWQAYLRLDPREQREILTWMEGLPSCLEIALGGRSFLLAHAGVGVYEPEKSLSDCVLHDFIWERMDYRKVYYQNKLLLTGHTPTAFIDPAMSGRILQRNNHIAIDCGAVYCGTLGCVCLETLEEFYVSGQEKQSVIVTHKEDTI